MTIAALAALMCGLRSTKGRHPIGGSRSDGVVRLAFTYGLFEQPKVDPNQAYRAAAQRCAAWGYSDAEAFVCVSTACINGTYQGCNLWQATVEYQCTGQPEKAALPSRSACAVARRSAGTPGGDYERNRALIRQWT
jgi:hypothetical protein